MGSSIVAPANVGEKVVGEAARSCQSVCLFSLLFMERNSRVTEIALFVIFDK